MTEPAMKSPTWEPMSTKSKIVNNLFLFTPLLFTMFFETTTAQSINSDNNLHILFYNVENLFDTFNDSLKQDEEFLPQGEYHWTYKKYTEKLNHIFQVIAATGENSPPAVIGFAEIENWRVLNDLITKTPLGKYPYQIIHHESPDPRGIDVAIIYRTDLVRKLDFKFYPLTSSNGNSIATREIVYFKARYKTDTLHFFVNHWPSRRSGQKQSEPKRLNAAIILKSKTDSILKRNPQAKLIVMGDFNDGPTDKSLHILTPENNSPFSLINLMDSLSQLPKTGTLKFGNDWNLFDQFIVSQNLVNTKNSNLKVENVQIISFPFLLVPDTKYGGNKLNRTFQGPVYLGGYSDHLPVILNIYKEKP